MDFNEQDEKFRELSEYLDGMIKKLKAIQGPYHEMIFFLDERIENPGTPYKVIDRPVFYWNNLPLYAQLYIKPAYNKIVDQEGLIEFLRYFLDLWERTDNEVKRRSIETVVFPLYEEISGGRHYDTNYFLT